MKKKLEPTLLKPIIALQNLMAASKSPWTIIGGVAASLLGKPRFTADVDAVILVDSEKIPKILKDAKKFGLKPRIKDPVSFAKKNRVLLLQHEESGINIDLSLGLLPFEIDAIRRSKRYKVGDIALNLPTIEDLIIFKAVAHRPQDLLDIQEIISLHPKIDKKYIEKLLSEFAQILEMPEILADAKYLLSHKKKS